MRYDENFVETHKLIIENLFDYFLRTHIYLSSEGSVLMARKKIDETGNGGKIIEIGPSVGSNGKEIPVVNRSIRKYRELRGLEQKELSRRLGIADSSVGNWERGFSKPPLDLIVPISKELGVSLYELFGIEDPMMKYTKEEQRIISKYKDLNEPHRKAVATMIDMLGDAEITTITESDIPELTVLRYFNRQLAAGIGDPSDMDDDGEEIYLYSNELIDKADYVFTVNGESMEPIYHNGDMVLVEKSKDIGYGEVGAFLIGNEAFIKESQKDGLHSYNKRYKTMKFTEDDSVQIIGRVIGVIDASDFASDRDTEIFMLHEQGNI